MKTKVAHALSLGVASNHEEDKGNAAFPKDSFSYPTLAVAVQTSQWFWIGPQPRTWSDDVFIPQHDCPKMRCGNETRNLMYKIFLVRLVMCLAKMVHLHAPKCETSAKLRCQRCPLAQQSVVTWTYQAALPPTSIWATALRPVCTLFLCSSHKRLSQRSLFFCPLYHPVSEDSLQRPCLSYSFSSSMYGRTLLLCVCMCVQVSMLGMEGK